MDYRGWLAIHAAKNTSAYADGALSPELSSIVRLRFAANWRGNLPRGMLIGAVHVVDCYPTEQAAVGPVDYHCGNYEPGRFAIKRDACLVLNQPIPVIGRQKYFQLPIETDREVAKQIINSKLIGWERLAEALPGPLPYDDSLR